MYDIGKIISIAGVISLFICNNSLAQNQFWEQYSLPGQRIFQLEIDRQNQFYAVSESGEVQKLLKSSDGISWELIFPPFQYYPNAPLQILIDTTNLTYDKIYLLKQEHVSSYYIDTLYYSINSGESWEIYSLPSDLGSIFDAIPEFAYSSNGDLYIPAQSNLRYTTNNGNTWETINTPNTGIENNTRLQIDIQGNIYTNSIIPSPIGGVYEEIWKSEDNGSTWVFDLSSWANGENFSAFETLPKGEIFAGAFADPYDQLYFKKNPDEDWIIYYYNTPGSMSINKYRYIYVSKWINIGNIIPSKYSPDYGTTWFNFDDGTLEIYNLIIDKDGYLYAATRTGIYRSIESTFPIVNKKSVGFPETAINDTTSREISILNPFNSQLIVDSTSLNSENFYTGFITPFVLEPGDSQLVNTYFTPRSFGSHLDTLFIYSNIKTENVFLSGDSPVPEFVTSPPGIYELYFGFTPIDSTKIKTIKIINHFVNFLEIDSIYTHKSQYNITSFDYPVYITSDSIDLDISFTPDSNFYYVDTVFIINNVTPSPYLIKLNGKGVQPVNTINEIEEVYRFALYDNYPNPFNPTTKIKYQLPELSKIKLTIYDVLGREVTALVNEVKPAGTYEVDFDGTNLPSGVYFYRIESGSYSDTKKFVLLK